MPFLSELDLRAVRNEPRAFRLLCPLVYRADNGEKLIVPADFSTDLASIPQLLQWAFPVNDLHKPAAVLHDFIFVMQDRTRSQADALFLEAMVSLGVPRWKRHAMYWGVRLGGALAWRGNARAMQTDRAVFLASHGISDTPRLHCVFSSDTWGGTR